MGIRKCFKQRNFRLPTSKFRIVKRSGTPSVERLGLSPSDCRFESCSEHFLQFEIGSGNSEVSNTGPFEFRPPISDLQRVVFPSPDCNPGVRKYWGGDERFDSFATHFRIRNVECGMWNEFSFRIPHSEFRIPNSNLLRFAVMVLAT